MPALSGWMISKCRRTRCLPAIHPPRLLFDKNAAGDARCELFQARSAGWPPSVIHPAIAQVMRTNGLEGTIAAPTFPAFTTRMSDIVPQLVVFPSRGPRVGANENR